MESLENAPQSKVPSLKVYLKQKLKRKVQEARAKIRTGVQSTKSRLRRRSSSGGTITFADAELSARKSVSCDFSSQQDPSTR